MPNSIASARQVVGLLLLAGLIVSPTTLSAQRTGRLLDPANTAARVESTTVFTGVRKAGRPDTEAIRRARESADSIRSEGDSVAGVKLFGRNLNTFERRQHALLLVGQGLTSTLRSSAWTASFVAFDDGKEGKVQANLCDVGLTEKACQESAAFSLTLIAPMDKKTKVAEVANLDGLTGTARAEVVWTYSATNATGKPNFSLKATGARPSFEYQSKTGLAKQSERHALYSVTGGTGMKWPTRSVRVEYQYQDQYTPQDSQSVCTPADFGPDGTLTCSGMVIGAPAHKFKNLVTGEARFAVGTVGGLGFLTAYDARSDVWGFELPIYAVPNLEGNGYSGGVRLGYRTDKKGITAVFFVSAFKL